MMFHIPYRTRRTLRRIGIGILAAAVALALVWGGWLLWVQRYIVYTRDGARLDFDLPPIVAGTPVEEQPLPQVSIYYNEGENAIVNNKELQQLQGYYITGSDLKDTEALKAQIRNLPAGTAVMMDVKNIVGNFYYSSSVSGYRSSAVDIAKVDEFIAFLDRSGMYTIARFPALRDYNYGLHHVSDGLPTAGGYLWSDGEGCYWLNPASQGTMSYLVQIVTELRNLGFDEVLLSDYYFPQTGDIVYRNNKADALTAAAKTLVTTCGTDGFCVSFLKEAEFTVPEGRTRIYRSGVAAAQAQQVAENSGLENPQVKLVFLTENHDTRFEDYGVLRPIGGAH